MTSAVKSVARDVAARSQRLGFRLDASTKSLVEEAARLERRKVSDYCLTALTEAAARTIERHRTLALSEEERTAFFDLLVDPPKPNDLLRRAFRDERRRVSS